MTDKLDLEPFMKKGGLGEFFNAARREFKGYWWKNTPHHSLRDVEAKTGINKSRLSRIEANDADIRVAELMLLLDYHGFTIEQVQPLLTFFNPSASGS